MNGEVPTVYLNPYGLATGKVVIRKGRNLVFLEQQEIRQVIDALVQIEEVEDV